MSEEPRNVIVFGKTTLDELERETIETIGYALYFTNRQLHTTSAKGTSEAVAAGYRRAGGKPIRHTTRAGDIPGPVIAVLDGEIINQLDRTLPGWEDRDWILISDQATLTYVADILTSEAERLRAEQGSGSAGDRSPVTAGTSPPGPAVTSGLPPHSVAEPGKAPAKSRGPSRSPTGRGQPA